MVKIRARKVCRVFNIRNTRGAKEGLSVLERFDLDVNEGEFMSLLGPSGCGKSTFLNILAGLDKFDSGKITVDGEPLQEQSFNRGIVFQGYALLPWRTVIQNLEVGLEIRHIEKKERRKIARHYLELVGLAAFENQYPHQLSGGMRQRVAIARVLAYHPDLLLMDEPFAALDAQTRENLQIELLRIWETDKKTILFVTHSIDEAILMSDRVAFMSSRPGHIREIISIDLPRPRTEDIRNSAEFASIRKNLWSMLQAEAQQIQSYGGYL
ncbi:MAG: ABC transporter ATP-binding protein [Synergistaceae bacterium]|jgi:NitT/TauT family transport system ATP-binding protein|nr:ABC transporter ATP-binding protein [Synergistaceae bacterium]